MGTHTQGPWLCCDGPENYERRIYVQESVVSGGTVCDVVLTEDAPLIAAAPDLLEALSRLVAESVHPYDGAEYEDGEWIALDNARRAIAKATPPHTNQCVAT